MAEGGKKNYFYRLFVQKSVWSRTLNLCEIKILLKLVLSMFLCSESRKIYHWKAKLCGQIRIAGAIARVLSSSIFSWKRCIEGAFYRRIYTRKNVVSTSEHETIFLFSTRSIFKQLLIYFWVGGGRESKVFFYVQKWFLTSRDKKYFYHRRQTDCLMSCRGAPAGIQLNFRCVESFSNNSSVGIFNSDSSAKENSFRPDDNMIQIKACSTATDFSRELTTSRKANSKRNS